MLSIALTLFAAAPDMNKKVDVDGQTYRVRVKDGYARVYSKAAIPKHSPAAKEARIQAARLATGCDLVDAEWYEISLGGRLVCP